MTDASKELRACPFCGEVPTLVEADANQGFKWARVVCCVEGPEVRTGYDTSPDAPWHAEAIAAWNLRTISPEDVEKAARALCDQWLSRMEHRWTPAEREKHLANAAPSFRDDVRAVFASAGFVVGETPHE